MMFHKSAQDFSTLRARRGVGGSQPQTQASGAGAGGDAAQALFDPHGADVW